ncbi:hypothetical protein FRC02_002327, partial [Tulasnella sp. 418]
MDSPTVTNVSPHTDAFLRGFAPIALQRFCSQLLQEKDDVTQGSFLNIVQVQMPERAAALRDTLVKDAGGHKPQPTLAFHIILKQAGLLYSAGYGLKSLRLLLLLVRVSSGLRWRRGPGASMEEMLTSLDAFLFEALQ